MQKKLDYKNLLSQRGKKTMPRVSRSALARSSVNVWHLPAVTDADVWTNLVYFSGYQCVFIS